ncbi:hypothetical protein BDZ97DRAFT_368938 [Flammula alnicola]|nr:hypothetical protein BDZ97DRAFT_368938 [Flammula alnicola]
MAARLQLLCWLPVVLIVELVLVIGVLSFIFSRSWLFCFSYPFPSYRLCSALQCVRSPPSSLIISPLRLSSRLLFATPAPHLSIRFRPTNQIRYHLRLLFVHVTPLSRIPNRISPLVRRVLSTPLPPPHPSSLYLPFPCTYRSKPRYDLTYFVICYVDNATSSLVIPSTTPLVSYAFDLINYFLPLPLFLCIVN